MTAEPENRTGQGRFAAGRSGNPGGRPKGFAEFQEKCRKLSPKALKVLEEALGGSDERIRIAAAQSIHDRAWGKAAQAITGPDGGPPTVHIVIDLGGK